MNPVLVPVLVLVLVLVRVLVLVLVLLPIVLLVLVLVLGFTWVHVAGDRSQSERRRPAERGIPVLAPVAIACAHAHPHGQSVPCRRPRSKLWQRNHRRRVRIAGMTI